MKTSTVLASLLFGSIAVAAPVNKRALVTHTEIVVETQIVYTTVWDYDLPAAEATTTAAGLFYEQPAHKTTKTTKTSTTSSAKKPQEPAYTPPAPPAPTTSSTSTTSTSIYTPPPKPTSVYTPPAPAPEPTTSAYVAPPAPSSTYVAPAPSSTPTEPSPPTDGNSYQGEVTVYDTYNAAGACGTTLSDEEMTAAVSVESWGADVWVDNLNQNPWCGKTATVTLNGETVTVKIMDKCMGCKPGDIDLTRKAWNKLTNNAYGSRLDGAWTTA